MQRAVTLLWVSLFVSLIVSVLEIDWPFPTEDAFAWSFIAAVAATYVFFAALIFLVSRRHNWARILVLLTTVIGALILFIPWPGVDFEWDLSNLISHIGLLALDGLALSWLFTGAGAAWYVKPKEGAF